MQNFGWAFLGCGGIAHTVARELIKDGGKIVACWNRTGERARQFAAQYGATAYLDAREALTAKGVNGAYIAVTHNGHLPLAQLCIQLGVPVLCEKPLTVNEGGAQQLFDMAKSKGVYLAEAMWTWFNDTAIKVREWVKSGKIGDVTAVSATYALPMLPFMEKERHKSPALIGGALLDIGIYPIRYVYELFGMPKGITCRGKLQGGVDKRERVVMDYGAFKANIHIARASLAGEGLKICGTQGKICVPYFHAASHARLTGKNGERFCDNSLKYAVQFRRAAEEISGGRTASAYCPPQSTIDTMRLLDECRAQMGMIYPCERQKDGTAAPLPC